ncbi:dihydroorotate dehydrogenase electron transfer subunit [Lachnospiraceae bacterium KH1T2]|nr:dihydroorotate dehydrogenase electron transfer subunit [Lachnospiraceae bacterium KH1T2]
MIQGLAVVKKSERLADGIYSIWLDTEIAKTAMPGQFVMVNTHSDAHLLGRPISISDIRKEAGQIRLVFRVVGYGSRELSEAKVGDSFELMGPMGNGFPVDKLSPETKVLLMGGGIGAPPLLGLANKLKKYGVEQVSAVLGYRGETGGLFLAEDFKKFANVYIATDDGSSGTHGTVVDAVRENDIQADIIFACGPMPMLSAIKKLAAEKGISAYISLEERMACGVGACLGCVVKTKKVDGHSHVNNSRICTEGPVFEAEEVEI